MFCVAFNALLHAAIFLATCNAILLVRDVNCSEECSSVIKTLEKRNEGAYLSFFRLSRVELHCKLQEKLQPVTRAFTGMLHCDENFAIVQFRLFCTVQI